MAQQQTTIPARTNAPLYSLGAGVALVALAILALTVIPERNQSQTFIVVGLIVTTVPSLIAAGFAERSSRDIRNGVVEEKVKTGATRALVETGVTDVVDASGRGASSTAAIDALTAHTAALTSVLQTMSPAPSYPDGTVYSSDPAEDGTPPPV